MGGLIPLVSEGLVSLGCCGMLRGSVAVCQRMIFYERIFCNRLRDRSMRLKNATSLCSIMYATKWRLIATHAPPPIALTADETRRSGRRRTSSAIDSTLPDRGSSCLRKDRCGNGRGSLWLWFAVDIFRIGLAQSRKPSWVVAVGTNDTACPRCLLFRSCTFPLVCPVLPCRTLLRCRWRRRRGRSSWRLSRAQARARLISDKPNRCEMHGKDKGRHKMTVPARGTLYR